MKTNRLRGIHVFWMVFGFFAIIVGTDTFFIVRALSTFPGEQVRNSYVLGLDYNRELESRARQTELGWKAQAGLDQNNAHVFVVRIEDAAKVPVTALDISVTYFVAGSGQDERQIALTEKKPGEYWGQLDLALKGRAEFNISARRAGVEAPVFEASKMAIIS